MTCPSLLDFPAFSSHCTCEAHCLYHRDNAHYLYLASYYPASAPFVRLDSEWQELEHLSMPSEPSRRLGRDWHALGRLSAS